MPYRFRAQPDLNLVVAVFEGEISPAEERQALQDFASDPGIDLSANLLIDKSRATSTVAPPDVPPQLELARAVFTGTKARPRMAIVAGTDFDFGMLRMLELRGGDELPHRMMVVRNLEDACEWLGVAADQIVWP